MPFSVNDPGHVAEHNRLQEAIPSGFVPASTDSPAFTGSPTAPTPAAGDSSGNIATTEFVAGVTANPAGKPDNLISTSIGGTVGWKTPQEHVARALGWAIVTDSRWGVGGADPTGAAYSDAAFTAALAAVPVGTIWVPPGTYKLAASITVGNGQTLAGSSGGHPTDTTSMSTQLTFPANVSGVVLAGIAAEVRDIALIGGGGTTGHGVTLTGGRTRVLNVAVKGFGEDGYNADTTSTGNVNILFAQNVHCYNNGRDGFHLAGSNSNAGTFLGCEAVANANYGIWNSATARNNFIGAHLSTNTGGGIYDAGNSNMYDAYVESGTGGTLYIDTGSSYGIFWGRNYAMPTVQGVASAQSSWSINKSGAFRGQMRVSDVADNAAGKTWKLDSGQYGVGWVTLSNDTDGVRLFRANTASTPQTVWYAHHYVNATNTYDLGTSAARWRDLFLSGVLHLPTYATGSRPSASTAGVGATVFDSTLNKPIWSTGSGWVDATGAGV